MKKILKTGGCIIFAALILLVSGCQWGDDGSGGGKGGSGLDDTNYTTEAAFKVRNETNQRLVAFKGSISTTTILGVVPANAQGHGIKKSNLFNSAASDAFPMILIKEADYKPDNTYLKTLEQNPFTRIYVFYNASGDNNVVYTINGRLGGNYKIEIQNPSSSLNVEIRLGGINGDTIGYAPGGMRVTNLYVNEGDFDIFPVFKRYNALRDIVETMYPKNSQGEAWARSLALGGTQTAATFFVQDAIDMLKTAFTSGMAMLVVNNTSNDAVQVILDGNPVVSPTGFTYFNGIKAFPIDLAVPGFTSSTFSADKTVSNIRVGPRATQVIVKAVADGNTTFVFRQDKLYTINVTGDQNTSIVATIEMREGTDSDGNPYPGQPTSITFDDFEGVN